MVAVHHGEENLVYEWGECFDGCHHQPSEDAALHHQVHDARGDVERCRAVLVHLLLQQQKKKGS